MFDQLQTVEGVSLDEDRIATGGLLDTGVYDAVVDKAYVTTSKGGALALNVVLDIQGRTVRQQFWMTSGTAKGGKNTYTDKNGKEQYLPGFNMADALALLTAKEHIGNLKAQDKIISLWSSEVQKEVDTEVKMFTAMLGNPVKVCLEKQIVDKTAKDASGAYVPNGETREQVEVVKFARAKDSMTVTEIMNRAEEAFYVHSWEEKFAGETRDKSKGAATGVTNVANPSIANSTKADNDLGELF